MPKLVRLYIKSCAIGFALAVGFVVALVVMDVAGLQRLILSTDMGWVAALMMIVFNGVVFSGMQFAIAIMLMAEDDDNDKRGPRGGRMIPIRVEAVARTRQGVSRRR